MKLLVNITDFRAIRENGYYWSHTGHTNKNLRKTVIFAQILGTEIKFTNDLLIG